MPNPYSIRSAVEADFPAIRQLIHLVGINPLGLAWQQFLVAVDEQGCMIGCGQIKPHRDGTRELASIAVVVEWRGQGVAGAIISRLIDKQPGKLYLTCRAGLGAFYERFGFLEARQEELTAYFRRIQRLVGLFQRVGLVSERLLVMVRE